MPNSKLPSTYKSLLTKVRETLILGQQRIEAQKVKTYWETGRLIQDDIFKNKGRADYGTDLVSRLARDLGLNPRILHYCIQFARAYPRPPILNGRSKFKWTHFRELISVPDPKMRGELEEKAARHNWSAEELGIRIKANITDQRQERRQIAAPVKQEFLVPKRGTLYTYRIVKRPELGVKGAETAPLLLDLGFGMYRRLTPRAAVRFSADQVVESDYDTKEETYALKASERTPKELFTYQAVIERVVDADTLKVRIDLGFDLEHRETLRLRDIDAPEVGTKAGDAAKAFVQSLLKEADSVILHTTRSDKYDRYLSDVFFSRGNEEEILLNNLLLEKGYAVRI